MHHVENPDIKSDAWFPEKIVTKNYFGALSSNTYVGDNVKKATVVKLMLTKQRKKGAILWSLYTHRREWSSIQQIIQHNLA